MGAGENPGAGLGQYQTGSLTGVTIQFADGKIKNLGEDMAKQEPGMAKIETATKGIHVDFPAFGVVGIGLSYAHDQIKDGASGAISMARTALRDYRTALEKLDKNYQKADKDNDGKISTIGDDNLGGTDGDKRGGPGGPGGVDPGKLAMPKTGMPDTKLPDSKVPGPQIPGSDVPGPDQSDIKIPGPNQPDRDLSSANVPNPNIPDPNLQNPNVPDTTLPTTKPPSIEDQLNHNTTVPDLNPGTSPVDPTKTNLASYDPTLNSAVPSTGTIPNTTTGVPTSTGTYSGSPSGSVPAANAAVPRAGAGSGMSGMPFMPMTGGGGAGGEQDRERDKPEYVRGDENDWLDDMDIAPPVLGE
ncbi:MAG: hypothetical protein HOV96_23600 [Nonomuraea sp.]|nr:hypothetical protein [Nonomuraea sp.]NUP64254.1 hypothetical protein [Nonomuraea sp.]NUP80533.1 hypothetical protein [Nonomuraea sp.]